MLYDDRVIAVAQLTPDFIDSFISLPGRIFMILEGLVFQLY